MKRIITIFASVFVCLTFVCAQEALKSTEEEYYDFLSLTGVVERPTLGYRTLSDSVWTYNDVESLEENEDGTYTKVLVPGEESDANIWKNNNLGTTYTLWSAEDPADNWFVRGIKQSLTMRIYGPEWFNSYNTAAPYGQNDGALWQGKGYNTALTAGVRFEGYGFEATFKPQVSFSQNLEFEYIPGVYGDTHSYNWSGNIDLVQRYGDDPFWNFDWGDSEIRWTWHYLTFGFGNQNPWLGPAILNPMLGSNNAPSYKKFDAGLRQLNLTVPYLNWDLGNIEGRIWVGKLKESNYFDNIETNNDRMLVAMSASYNPSFIPGLSIGLNRVFLTHWQMENLSYIFRLFTTSGSNGDEDQKFALFAQWAFPKIGFRIYGEFGRDDFSSNENTNPFHTAIYTVGAKQDISLPFGLKSEFSFEWNNFEMSQDFQLQWDYMGYYAHSSIKQGYTNKGQILGAGSGYFGNSQFLQYKVYYPQGYTAFKFHRYCPNNNSVYSKAVYTVAEYNSDFFRQWYANFETYFYYGVESCYHVNSYFNVTANFAYIRIYCPNYKKNTQSQSYYFALSMKYVF